MIKIRFNPIIAGPLLLAGAFVTGTGIWMADWLLIAAGGLSLVIGGLFTINPQLELENGTLKIRSVMGTVRKEIQINHPRELFIDGKMIFMEKDGRRIRIPGISKGMSHQADWRMFGEFTDQARKRTSRPGNKSSVETN
ncbi:MAG: hypothetical protein H6581_02415 [Bacteroidia bacterium]|nr:hypothetical protein [Bacteroidia bacterium]